MGVVPNTRIGQIEFYETHLPLWAASPSSIGLSAGQVSSLNTLVTAARSSFNAAEGARVASKDATLVFHNKTDAMDALGADLIKIIKAFAAFQNDPNVYALAGIPAPATPTPVPAPGTPTAFTVALEPTGALRLAWQCNNPTGSQGTVYEVQRRIGSAEESVFTFVGSTGKRFFVDSSLPPGACGGSAGVTYRITAVRSTKQGITGTITINFGAGLTVTEQTGAMENEGGENNQMKMAA